MVASASLVGSLLGLLTAPHARDAVYAALAVGLLSSVATLVAVAQAAWQRSVRLGRFRAQAIASEAFADELLAARSPVGFDPTSVAKRFGVRARWRQQDGIETAVEQEIECLKLARNQALEAGDEELVARLSRVIARLLILGGGDQS